MRLHLTAAFLAATASVSAPSAPALADGLSASAGTQVRISCQRYFSRQIIWDRPRAVFIDDLVAIGYSYERASAIAHRICRDETLLDNEEAMGPTLLSIVRNSPPGR